MISFARRFSGILLFSSLLLLPGCKGMDETEQLSRDYFELLKAGENQVAYDQSSTAFQSSVSYEDFVAFNQDSQFGLYEDFSANSYYSSTKDDLKLRSVTGDINFSDGAAFVIRVDWVEEDGTWKFRNLEFNPEEDSSEE